MLIHISLAMGVYKMKNKSFSILKNEVKRIFCSKATLLVILISAFSPLLKFLPIPSHLHATIQGMLFACSPVTGSTHMLYPVKLAAVVSGLAFFVLTLYEFSKIDRYNINELVEPIVNIKSINLYKTIGLILAGCVSTLISSIIMLPYTIFNLHLFSDYINHIMSYLIIDLPTIIICILLTAGLYMMIKRVDIVSVIVFILVVLSFKRTSDYFMNWLQGPQYAYSSDYGVTRDINLTLLNRFFALSIALAVYLIGFLCTRVYNKNFLKSFIINNKKSYFVTTFIAIVLVSGSVCLHMNDPIRGGLDEFDYEIDRNENIVIKKGTVDLKVSLEKKRIDGVINYKLENLSNKQEKVIVTLLNGENLTSVKINNKKSAFKDLNLLKNNLLHFELTLPSDKDINLEICYSGKSKDTDFVDSLLAWCQISSKYINVHRLCSPKLNTQSENLNDLYTGTVTIPSDLTLIAMGQTNHIISESNGYSTWDFSYWNVPSIYCAKYKCITVPIDGNEVEIFYHENKEKQISEIQNHVKQIYNYFASKFGGLDFDYPFKIFPNREIGGGGAGRGYSTMAEPCMDEDLIKKLDFENKSSLLEVFAHEICHQWWGTGVECLGCAYFDVEGAKDRWSAEGPTVYWTYRFLKECVNDESSINQINSWKDNFNKLQRSFYYRHPEHQKVLPEKYINCLKSDQRWVKHYNMMPLEILQAEKVLGTEKFDEAFRKIFQDYYKQKNEDGSPKELTYEEFLKYLNLTEEEISVE